MNTKLKRVVVSCPNFPCLLDHEQDNEQFIVEMDTRTFVCSNCRKQWPIAENLVSIELDVW